jgi:mono/diheme cytochrome c family protein
VILAGGELVQAISRRAGSLALALSAAGVLAAQTGNWQAPAEAKSIKNPSTADEKSVANGKKLFKQNCVPCHGDSGVGDGATAKTLGIKAGNLTDKTRMRAHADGEIFWKISKGKDPMPVFERKLSVKERWDLVNFVRTLH